jgi:nitric oxide reductase large subunit
VTDVAKKPATPRVERAKTNTAASTHADAPAIAKTRDGNPFMTLLVVFTVIAGLVALVLYIIGETQNQGGDDPLGQAASLDVAGRFVNFALILFVGTMIAGAINWQLTRLKK